MDPATALGFNILSLIYADGILLLNETKNARNVYKWS